MELMNKLILYVMMQIMSTTYLIVRVNKFEEAIDVVKNELKVDEVGYTNKNDCGAGSGDRSELGREIVMKDKGRRTFSFNDCFGSADCYNKNLLKVMVGLWEEQDAVYDRKVSDHSLGNSVTMGKYLTSYALDEASKKTKNKYTHHAIVTDQAIKLKSVTIVERIDVVYMFYQKSLDNIEVLYHHFFHNVFNTLDDFRLAARQLIKENAYLRLDLRTHTIGLYELVKIE